MNNQVPTRLSRFRPTPLAACLSMGFVAGSMMTAPVFASTTWQVGNCQDNGAPTSLRVVAANPLVQPGDIIDLSGLPLACGNRNSVVTLQVGAIAVTHPNITFRGPTPDKGSVTINAADTWRHFVHVDSGTLTIENLTLVNGHAGNYGGCIVSVAGNVYLLNSVVSGCTVSGGGNQPYHGGAISAAGDVVLFRSTVSGSTIAKANIDKTNSSGGGIFAGGDISALYSSISDNHISTVNTSNGRGGGLYTLSGTIHMDHSTIENNSASGEGGGIAVALGSTMHYITNSTVSGNSARKGGGVNLTGYGNLTVSNSTIAFNHATYSQAGFGGLAGCFGCTLTLQSSIVADNTDGEFNAPSDLYADPAKLHGSDNLVTSSNMFAPPAGIITMASDPKLGPLQFNGGPTRSHALLSGSPAIGIGNNKSGYPNDQRGPGYPRTTGQNVKVDIGAFEYDSIFANALEQF